MDPNYPQAGGLQPLSSQSQPKPAATPAAPAMQQPIGAPSATPVAPAPVAAPAGGSALEQVAAQARHIALTTAANPYQQALELERLRTNYLNTTYGMTIKLPE